MSYSLPEKLKSPFEDPHKIHEGDHLVQFYESDEFLTQIVTDYVVPSLGVDEGVIIIATADHQRLFLDSFDAFFEVKDLLAKGQLVMLDAEEMMGKFILNGALDEELFYMTVGGQIQDMKKKFKNIKAYGEMVNLLWQIGNQHTTFDLEKAWSEVCVKAGITLLCAYQINNFEDEMHWTPFHQICHSHTHVVPTEEFLMKDRDDQLRMVAMLQQRSRALEKEIAVRKKYEMALKRSFEQLSQLKYNNRSEHDSYFPRKRNVARELVGVIGAGGVIHRPNLNGLF